MQMEEKKYKYFKRDMSWLSFNYRVLMEAADASLPIYERLHFLSIYSSNLEEFYAIRISEHRSDIIRKNLFDESVETSQVRLENITKEVNRQKKDYYRIFFEKILPELQQNNIILYQTSEPEIFHKDFVIRYFNEEVFPFLSPVTLQKGIKTFIRDRRLYLVAAMRYKTTHEPYFVLIKIPFSKVPRFITLPKHGEVHYYMFVDDVIKYNLPYIFPGFEVEGCFSIKISRDADIFFDDEKDIVNEIRERIRKRKNGAVMRFMYDASMPRHILDFLCSMFEIEEEDLITGGRYLNLWDLIKLPNPAGKTLERKNFSPVHFRNPEVNNDILLHFPYHSFNYLLRFLQEASIDPDVKDIKITQYRVAENSAVINSLIQAARSGKNVTVCVEVKARFDEENNVNAAEQMKNAGIKITYSISGLKVHAKAALITKKTGHYAILSTGNFNEKTATVYSDMALFTTNKNIVEDVAQLFSLLENQGKTTPVFTHLLVAQYNMMSGILKMIHREIENVQQGKRGYIILKMNGLHDKTMIDELYGASEAGVEIDLIIRGICCIVPNQPYSQNIRITRIVDTFLEHSRIWYFYNNGNEDVYLTSADWMRRNLSRRIETAVPILSPRIKKQIIDILNIQLRDNVKACTIDENLNNIYKRNNLPPVRAQAEIYSLLSKNTED
jgi:polyphosphate kinase